MDLQEAFDAGFEAVKAYVEQSFDAFEARIDAMDKRLAEIAGKAAPAAVVGALIDRSGNLVVTMSDGTAKDLGLVVGKDGEPGKPGQNGFNLEDFDASVMDDGRTVLLSFTGKEMDYKIELGFPVMLYRGVFKDGQPYERGDTVTWAGSLWHCDAEKTSQKPGDGSSDWTLCAKKGRDGKNGEAKEATQFQTLAIGVPAKGK